MLKLKMALITKFCKFIRINTVLFCILFSFMGKRNIFLKLALIWLCCWEMFPLMSCVLNNWKFYNFMHLDSLYVVYFKYYKYELWRFMLRNQRRRIYWSRWTLTQLKVAPASSAYISVCFLKMWNRWSEYLLGIWD